MKKACFEDIVHGAAPEDNLIIVFNTISGHGGYAAGQTTINVSTHLIKCLPECAAIKLLNDKVLKFDTSETGTGILYVEYDEIKMVVAVK